MRAANPAESPPAEPLGDSGRNEDLSRGRARVIIGAIVLLSAAVLFLNLDGPSLWEDEVATIRDARPRIGELLAEMPRHEPHPPLSFLAVHVWIGAFGENEAGLRFLFALAALLTVPVIYRIARQLRYERRTALTASYLFAISPLVALFGRMIRYYSFGLLFGALSVWAFVALRDKWRWRHAAFYIVATLLLMYSCYLAFVLIVVQSLIALCWRRPHLGVGRWALMLVLLLAGYAPWSGIMVREVLAQRIGEYGGSVADLNPSTWAVPIKVAYSLGVFSAGETLFPWHWRLTVPLALAVLCAAGGLCRRLDRRTALLAAFTIVPILCVSFVTTYLALRISFIYTAARTFFAVPYFWMLVAVGITALRWRALRWGVLVALTAVNGVGLANYHAGREYLMPVYAVPWKTALKDVVSGCRSDGNDALMTDEPGVVEYYARQKAYPFRLIHNTADAIAWLEAHPQTRLHLLITGRDSTQGEIPADVLEWIRLNYVKADMRGYVPMDPVYQRLKRRILHREPYPFKLEYTLWLRKSAPGAARPAISEEQG